MKTFIHNSFWSDADIEELTPGQKLTVIWLLTNSQMTVCGFCQVTPRRFAFETGLEKEVLVSTIEALPRSFKHYEDGTVYSRRFIQRQLGSGEQLKKNNIFKSLVSVFNGIKNLELKEAIATDYPEISEAAEFYQALPEPDHTVAKGLRAMILARDEFTCLFSGEVLDEADLHIDHVIPRSKGGKTEPGNLMTVSRRLNALKKDRSMQAFCESHGFDFLKVSETITQRASKPLSAQRKGKEKGMGKEGIGKDEGNGESTKARAGSQAEVEAHCREIGLYPEDAEWFWFKCGGNGWQNGGKPIKDWKQTLRSWKAGNYVPSSKPGFATVGWPAKPKPPEIQRIDEEHLQAWLTDNYPGHAGHTAEQLNARVFAEYLKFRDA